MRNQSKLPDAERHLRLTLSKLTPRMSNRLYVYQVGQLTLQRPGSSLGVSTELQLQEALQLQRQQTQQQMQAQLSALQQQRLLQGHPQQHLHDSTSLQLQQLQQQQHQQQLQQQQSNLLQSAGWPELSMLIYGV